jgi:uncharacterized protein
MELLDGVHLEGLSIFFSSGRTLVISDLHIGLETELGASGLALPRFQLESIKRHLAPLLTALRPKTIIINGDLKHGFGELKEWKEALELVGSLQKVAKVLIVEGNHDRGLDNFKAKAGLEVSDHAIIDNVYICHGDALHHNKEIKGARAIIIGHEHPAISVRDGARSELFKTFLVGEYERRPLIVMPSYSFASPGTDMTLGKTMSPYIKDVLSFDSYVSSGKIYNFGKIGNLR